MKKKKNIIVDDGDISLRQLNRKDVFGPWWEWFNDKEVTKFMNKGHQKNSPQMQLKFYEKMEHSNSDCVLGIFYNKDNKHIGTTAIHDIRNDLGTRKGNFGIVIGEKYFWGKGIGTKAWKMMVDYAFMKLNLDIVETLIFDSNKASLKVAKKLGFEKKEIKSNDLIKDGETIDRIFLTIDKKKWKMNA